jgi:hypothetical protein
MKLTNFLERFKDKEKKKDDVLLFVFVLVSVCLRLPSTTAMSCRQSFKCFVPNNINLFIYLYNKILSSVFII